MIISTEIYEDILQIFSNAIGYLQENIVLI